jgi:hypothetical protein
MFSQFIPTIIPNNPQKVIKKLGIFQYGADIDATPWHVSSPLNLAPSTAPFPKFKDHFLKFSINKVKSSNEHLSTFSNSCANIGAHDNDTCMRLFVNFLEGRVVVEFFDFPDNIFSNGFKLM